MDFISGNELLKLCEENHYRISDVMREREASEFGSSPEETIGRMKEAYRIMKEACHKPLDEPVISVGGLIGGESAKVRDRRRSGKSICGSMLSKAITYSLAVLEVNASMGLIVAAPTAGSSGVLPGLLLALEEEFSLDDNQIIDGLFTASAVGYLIMRNATVAGAQAGCQAEVGAASAMAAAAAAEIMGGTPRQCLDAATVALSNLLGLVCDPVAGLVEYPCQNRNVIGAANALVCAEMALSGIVQFIPFDQMVDTMMAVGRSIPFELRETALGGCAATDAACRKTCEIFKSK
ncbi:L-serine ammonia-lyase, iron-sulfur-dependent, subunit alpha [Lachnoclostridium phytofermentans]|uniref:L-serine dehydratase n=1 Tax=Lachnoclostridium phytofermentans (strain ATCC 700394 / DSM 18823 / ISDg) TaxID=357809 RepID=A9KPT4_LACP7|nr:L-serine ammonia-lyase, iron-sulfur-dependent, subunit alpha [Lachnoclostridium phytofermentans]ABX41833.1 L-serine dehydratase, iron-sulfur-dependent, alpha subunit [Lachnoclostridium phytofermentans ISDg]